MKKSKTLAKTYDISKDLYYDHALYEHDHKETHAKDIRTLVKINLRQRKDHVADTIVENGIIYN